MDPERFYKRKHDAKSSYFEEKTRKFERISKQNLRNTAINRPNTYNARTITESIILSGYERFKVHSKLVSALSELEKGDLRVFSRERWLSFENRSTFDFITCTLDTFCDYYFKLEPNKRNLYEVIPQNKPCKLYFDLEYYTHFNKHILDGDLLIQWFIDYFIAKIKKYYEVEYKHEDVIWLDSSSKEKYSCHLIFHSDEYYFFNNYELGRFVSKCYSEILDHFNTCCSNYKNMFSEGSNSDIVYECSDNICQLMVRNKQGGSSFVADTSVYSKNRSFRIYNASKLNSDRFLQLSKSNKFQFEKYKKSLLKPYSLSCQQSIDYSILVLSLCVPNAFYENLNYEKNDSLIYPKFYNNTVNIEDDFMNSIFEISEKGANKIKYFVYNYSMCGGNTCKNVENERKSISRQLEISYENCDNFCKHIEERVKLYLSEVSSHNKGFIRKIIYKPEIQSILYEVGCYKFCHNIHREHKSNHIYYVARLNSSFMDVVQMCHDYECRKFISAPLFYINSSVSFADISNVENDLSVTFDDSTIYNILCDNSFEASILNEEDKLSNFNLSDDEDFNSILKNL